MSFDCPLFVFVSDWIEHGLHVYEVQSNTKSRQKFRQVARDTCGESMEPPEDNLVMFGELEEEKGKISPTKLMLFSVYCIKRPVHTRQFFLPPVL